MMRLGSCSVDGASRKAWGRALKKKTSAAVAKAWREIIQEENGGIAPGYLAVDAGTEFLGTEMRAALEEYSVGLIITNPPHKATMAERLIGSLKAMLAKREAEEGGRDWPRHLQRILSAYNQRHHRSIGMAPNDVTLENIADVLLSQRAKAFARIAKRASRSLIPVGTRVRLRLTRPKFSKVSTRVNSEDVFLVGRILFTLSGLRYKLYALEDKSPIIGTFSADELIEVNI